MEKLLEDKLLKTKNNLILFLNYFQFFQFFLSKIRNSINKPVLIHNELYSLK